MVRIIFNIKEVYFILYKILLNLNLLDNVDIEKFDANVKILWNKVHNNPDDFFNWTNLLKVVASTVI